MRQLYSTWKLGKIEKRFLKNLNGDDIHDLPLEIMKSQNLSILDRIYTSQHMKPNKISGK